MHLHVNVSQLVLQTCMRCHPLLLQSTFERLKGRGGGAGNDTPAGDSPAATPHAMSRTTSSVSLSAMAATSQIPGQSGSQTAGLVTPGQSAGQVPGIGPGSSRLRTASVAGHLDGLAAVEQALHLQHGLSDSIQLGYGDGTGPPSAADLISGQQGVGTDLTFDKAAGVDNGATDGTINATSNPHVASSNQPAGPSSSSSGAAAAAGMAAAAAAAAVTAATSTAAAGGGGRGFLGLGHLKRAAAATAQSLTANLAESLARVPCQLVLDVTRFEGSLMLWVGPPPSDRCVAWCFQGDLFLEMCGHLQVVAAFDHSQQCVLYCAGTQPVRCEVCPYITNVCTFRVAIHCLLREHSNMINQAQAPRAC